MVAIYVNGVAQDVHLRPKNLGELLDRLETGTGRTRRVVTAVRLRGVVLPTFRDPSSRARRLTDTAPLDIETSTVASLLHDSAREASQSLGPLRNAVGRVAWRLRGSDVPAGRRDLSGITSALQNLAMVTAMLATTHDALAPGRRDFDALVLRLCRIVDAIISKQAAQDWIAVGEILERDLAPTLDEWASTLDALGDEDAWVPVSEVA